MTGGDGDDQFVFFKGQGRESTENAFFDNFDDRTQLSGSNWSQWTENNDSNSETSAAEEMQTLAESQVDTKMKATSTAPPLDSTMPMTADL